MNRFPNGSQEYKLRAELGTLQLDGRFFNTRVDGT
jgi:hypothetical protein